MDRSAQLAELLQRSEPLALHLTLALPWTTGRTKRQRQSLLQVLSNCMASRTLVSLELHFTSNDGPEWPTSLLRASAPHLQDLCLAINRGLFPEGTDIVPDQPLSDLRPTSLALHFVHPQGLGRGPGMPIPDCFTHLTHLSLYTYLYSEDLAQALSQIFFSCQHLTDLTLLWLIYGFSGGFSHWWPSPPALSPLKRLRIVLPDGNNNRTNVIRAMRCNHPHLSVCVRDVDWEHCLTDGAFLCKDAQTVRLAAIFTDPVMPRGFIAENCPPVPGVPAYAQITFYNETRSGESFYLRTIGGSLYTQGVVLDKSRLMTTRPLGQLAGLVSVTVAEALWDVLARSVGSMPLLKNLDILVASRQPGIYWVQSHTHQGVQPMVFSERMTMPDGSPEVETRVSQTDFHERSPYRCICPVLETLRLAQDPHFAKVTGEHAVKVEAWQIARFIGHQLGWEAYGTVGSELPLQLVLQRVEFDGRDLADERQEILNRIIVEESYATFVHQDVETCWDRPYYPKPQVWV